MFEKPSKDEFKLERQFEWKEKRLGIWYKTYETVSRPKDSPAKLGKDGKTSTSRLFGVDLIISKFWIDICYRPLTLEI